MKTRVLPELPDLEIADEAISTWNIEDYRSLQQKERGPIFECGGHPWYVRHRGLVWKAIGKALTLR